MRKGLLKGLAIISTGALLLTSVSVGTVRGKASAESDEASTEIDNTYNAVFTRNDGLIKKHFEDSDGNRIIFNKKKDNNDSGKKRGLLKASTLPESYDATDNYVTSIKDQGYTGSCWSFSMMKTLEATAIKEGYETKDSADFSESHLVYYSYFRNTDSSDSTYGDCNYLTSSASDACTYPYMIGGSVGIGGPVLLRGTGIASESSFPFSADSNSELEDMGESMEAYGASEYYHIDNYRLTGFKDYSYSDADEIKQALIDNGVLTAALYYDTKYLKTTSDSYDVNSCYYQNLYTETDEDSDDYAPYYADHAVTLIGYDDNYPASNFKNTPAGNGAWLIANSHGTNASDDNGYFWLSYYDASFSDIYSMQIEKKDFADDIFQYDGNGYGDVNESSGSMTLANIYENSSDTTKYIHSAGIYTVEDNQSCIINVMKNPAADMSSGDIIEDAYTVLEGDKSGFYTVPLTKAVAIEPGESFAILVTYMSNGGTVYYPIEGQTQSYRDSDYGTVKFAFASKAEQSFYYSRNRWSDSYYKTYNNFCIKG
nr:hypothetical protein [Lachnospiraceae bacterium]